MLKLKLLSLGFFFSFTQVSHAGDWLCQVASVAKDYIYENNHVVTGVAALGAAVYLLLPDKDKEPVVPVDVTPSVQAIVEPPVEKKLTRLEELRAQYDMQGRYELAENKRAYRDGRTNMRIRIARMELGMSSSPDTVTAEETGEIS